MKRARLATWTTVAAAVALLAGFNGRAVIAQVEPKLELHEGDRIILIGNTLAERMQYFGHFETLLQGRFPGLDLVFHDLGWSADELTLRPRSAGFQDHGHTLADEKPDVLIAAFGFNESFAGPGGLPRFRKDLDKFIEESTATKYNGKAAPRLILLSPIAHENLRDPHVTDGKANNKNLRLYADAMAEAARAHKVAYLDLFRPTLALMDARPAGAKPLTINGVHLTEAGDEAVAALIDGGLFGPRPTSIKADLTKLRATVLEKNLQFFHDYRAINGCYIYGGRKSPFGVVNFPEEFAKLRKMIANRERRVWAIARGEDVPPTIDDSDTGTLERVQTNAKGPIRLTDPDQSRQTFTLPEGYEANLFASEVDFPDLKKPVQLTFDARGRLWVSTMPSYPQYLPGRPVDDKVLILEDTDGDGKADKQTVFADKLHVPTGLELGDGGLYLSQQPNLMFLKDVDGDDKADTRDLILHGFDTADSHHAMHAFTWDPGGALYWQEGTFHHTQVETPHGPRRVKDAGVFRFEPKSKKLDIFVSYGFANPWGHTFDRWGQDLVADASGGANYFATAFSGDVDYPNKHAGMHQFLKMEWRPTSGCELVSSRNFPDEVQGEYLLNNVIGFQGVLRYRMKEDGSGFHGDPIRPSLLRATDPNFRPVDLEFGPDGALYLVDWYNPLIGHMQHSLRDPNRDVGHGRIWRIRYTKKPLVEKARIAGATVPELLDLLKTFEDRTRYRARIALREQPSAAVLAELDRWVAGLYKNDPDYWHHMLEALWVRQSLDAHDAGLLKQMLSCPEPKARAAATRVLCYWRDKVEDPIEMLRKQVADENARVRLEAVRALSFFDGKDAAKAQEAAMDSLLQGQDYYLEYTLDETNKTLDRRIKAAGK